MCHILTAIKSPFLKGVETINEAAVWTRELRVLVAVLTVLSTNNDRHAPGLELNRLDSVMNGINGIDMDLDTASCFLQVLSLSGNEYASIVRVMRDPSTE